MSIWTIAWRSIQQRGLASTLTALSMALGVTLVVAVLVVENRVEDSFHTNSSLGYDVIVGAKGGQLQLVLNTVFHLSQPVENIPYWYYKEFLPASERSDHKDGQFSQFVERAVPICMGDYFQDYRVVATTPDFFTAFADSDAPKYEFTEGRAFKTDEPFTGVIGAEVARKTGLKVGDVFAPSHGVASGGHVHDPFKIVGVLKRIGTPSDRAVYANMEGFYQIGDHALPKYLQRKPTEVLGPDMHDDHDHDKHPRDEKMHDDHDHDAKPGEGPATAKDKDHDDGQIHAADRKHATNEDAPADHDDDKAKPAADSKTAPAKPAAEHADHDHDAKPGKPDADHDHAAMPDHDHADHDDHDDHDQAGHDHAGHHHHAPLTEEEREVTAILIRTKQPVGAMGMQKYIDKDSIAQMSLPIMVITQFFEVFVRPFQYLLLGLSVLIIIVSGISIMVSIYNSMNDRKHEIAVMRALGASRSMVMWIVLLESILLSLAGGVAGWLLGHGLIAVLSPWILNSTGVSIGFLQGVPMYEAILIPGLVLLASLVGYLPALTAYRTDVARALTATP